MVKVLANVSVLLVKGVIGVAGELGSDRDLFVLSTFRLVYFLFFTAVAPAELWVAAVGAPTIPILPVIADICMATGLGLPLVCGDITEDGGNMLWLKRWSTCGLVSGVLEADWTSRGGAEIAFLFSLSSNISCLR